MAIPKHHYGFVGDMCQCGRRASLIHCPTCGSSSNRARHNRLHKHMDGQIKFVDVELVCNLCGVTFVHEDRKFCNATPIGIQDATRKLHMLAEAASSPNLTPDQQTAASTAKKLLGEIGALGSRPDEIRALKKLAQIAEVTPEVQHRDFVNMLYVIKGEYNDSCRMYKEEKGEEYPEPLKDYVVKILVQHGIERVPNPKGEDADEQWIRELYQ